MDDQGWKSVVFVFEELKSWDKEKQMEKDCLLPLEIHLMVFEDLVPVSAYSILVVATVVDVEHFSLHQERP